MASNQSRANEGDSPPRTGEGLMRKVAEDDVEGHRDSQPREGDSLMRKVAEDDVEGAHR